MLFYLSINSKYMNKICKNIIHTEGYPQLPKVSLIVFRKNWNVRFWVVLGSFLDRFWIAFGSYLAFFWITYFALFISSVSFFVFGSFFDCFLIVFWSFFDRFWIVFGSFFRFWIVFRSFLDNFWIAYFALFISSVRFQNGNIVRKASI